ncbi:hypothetical protein BC628DRAFT_238452 [Trametes gibbosa]|nr:hypothetical protein BC628DRAFT_238452 [Trametes gibbosa]
MCRISESICSASSTGAYPFVLPSHIRIADPSIITGKVTPHWFCNTGCATMSECCTHYRLPSKLHDRRRRRWLPSAVNKSTTTIRSYRYPGGYRAKRGIAPYIRFKSSVKNVVPSASMRFGGDGRPPCMGFESSLASFMGALVGAVHDLRSGLSFSRGAYQRGCRPSMCPMALTYPTVADVNVVATHGGRVAALLKGKGGSTVSSWYRGTRSLSPHLRPQTDSPTLD